MNESHIAGNRAGIASQRVALAARILAALTLCGGLNGCVVLGASSRGGFFMWPGGLGLLLVVVVLVLLLRRR